MADAGEAGVRRLDVVAATLQDTDGQHFHVVGLVGIHRALPALADHRGFADFLGIQAVHFIAGRRLAIVMFEGFALDAAAGDLDGLATDRDGQGAQRGDSGNRKALLGAGALVHGNSPWLGLVQKSQQDLPTELYYTINIKCQQLIHHSVDSYKTLQIRSVLNS